MASAWEGQPAMVQMEDAGGELTELAGVFLTRETADQKRPDRMRAWFGMNADELERRGVRPGLGVTGYKEGHRIGAHRFTARSMDDRAGTTALLLALRASTRTVSTIASYSPGRCKRREVSSARPLSPSASP